jgi:adenosine deaminase
MRRWLRTAALATVTVAAALLLALALVATFSDAAVTAARFRTLHTDHTALRAFLRAMPKGADLHVHLSGAVYAENLIAWAAEKGLCVRLPDVFIMPPPCDATTPPVAEAIRKQSTYDDMVNALSIRFFVPSANTPSVHDQFFDAFSKYGAITALVPAEMVANVLRQYAAQSVQHTELMLSFLGAKDRIELAAAIKDEPDFARRLAILKDKGLDALVTQMRAQVATVAADIKATLGCGADQARPGCSVSYRLIAQVTRVYDEREVFVQTAFAAALIRAESLVAGLNFVGPEDNRVARESYRRHMEMIAFLAKDVPVALHAGELWLGLVPPEDLTFHIHDAVMTAGARRIGHGVSLAYEPDMRGLLAEMRKRQVAVEINLTSNDLILRVSGKDHPLPTYRAAGVPIVLSTDDAGVSRIDLSNEYFRAACDYRLGYRDLKAMARNSLTYSFLAEADKRDVLARFDKSIAAFERGISGERSLFGNMATLVRGLFAR